VLKLTTRNQQRLDRRKETTTKNAKLLYQPQNDQTIRPGPAYKTACHCERSAAIFHCLTFNARMTQAKAQCHQMNSADVGRIELEPEC
jgi:hypothetical protein